jgi:pimeloyl-ACP methyl ester carboxylesterase
MTRSASPKPTPPRSIPPRPAPAEPPPLVSGRWLLGAFLISVAAAAVCGYGVLCLLFYQGQWQLLFHPSRTISATPAQAQLPWEDIRFDVTATGQPQLDGWWIPSGKANQIQTRPGSAAARPGTSYANNTVLYLHDARGSLSDCIPQLATLHSLGLNLFAFDYRGFGRSMGRHPTERLGTADTIAAWTYLTDIRHIPARHIVVFGNGLGAVYAVRLATRFAPAGVILEDPPPPARQVLAADARSRIVPLSLLQNEFLDPLPYLGSIHAPLLFLERKTGDVARTRALFSAAPPPKQIYDLRSATEASYLATLRRFLDEALH